MNSARLSRIELFAFDNRPSFAHRSIQNGCWYLVLRLTSGEHISYGECVVPMNGEAIDLIKWGAFLRSIHRSTLEEAFQTMQQMKQEWTSSQLSLLQSALSGMLNAQYPRLTVAAGSARHVHQVFSKGNIIYYHFKNYAKDMFLPK
ncbi:hypothetical protein [Paenibacillus donghaensis]|uniref:Uncharacterized protein n=1 Tax=Paenibacillus donghaensis TaxID=414771 RepID=A0A2Z2KH38_9BACL|nr:hypothetical protein [Paenibacillus donghaensis]ASA20152.1 hypothetical protein B9T62_04670 [Paenibacillus donghaensis]